MQNWTRQLSLINLRAMKRMYLKEWLINYENYYMDLSKHHFFLAKCFESIYYLLDLEMHMRTHRFMSIMEIVN